MSVTFRVDDVALAASPPTTQPLSARFPDTLALGVPGDLQLVQPPGSDDVGMPTDARGIHPLLAAVHSAFAEHRPLILSPDVLWITIAQGVAQHVRLHAEELRRRFVRHEGRKQLSVTASSWATAEDWQEIVASFRVALAEELGGGVARLLTCDFSTTTDVERTASEIVLMDAFSPYYDYTILCICGIPEITLRGTPADWRAIRARIDVIAELGLGFWTASLAPMADQWVRAAEGAPDPEFWRAIYKPRHAYGWDRIAGWVARLFPYLAEEGRFTRRNPLFEHRIGDEPKGEDLFSVPGMGASEAPSGISSVRCKLQDAITHATQRVLLEGGVLGVTCDAGGRLEAQCGWLVRREAPTMRAVIERMRETPGAVLSPRGPRAEGAEREPSPFLEHSLGAELEELFDEIDQAVLFDGDRRWTVARPRPMDLIAVRSKAWPWQRHAVRVVDLHDGTFLARMDERDGSLWVRMRADRVGTETVGGPSDVSGIVQPREPVAASSEDGAALPVVGQSLAEILDRALDTNGAKDLPVQTRPS
jgi:hypothetical protein